MKPRNRPVVIVLPPVVPELFDALYPSLPVLAACLAAQGFGVLQLDLNRRYVASCFDDPELERVIREAAGRLAVLDQRAYLTPAEAAHYESDHQRLLAASFVRRQRFRLGGKGAGLSFQLDGTHDLTAFLGRLVPARADGAVTTQLAEFLRRAAAEIASEQPLLVALSVPMGPQLEPAVVLAREIRTVAPDLPVVLGGPVVSLLHPFALADVAERSGCTALARYEGEEALPALAEALVGGTPLTAVPNLLVPDGAGGFLAGPPARLRRLDAVPLPQYSAAALAAAPHASLSLVLARGCYWGRCAYCDYVHLYGPGAYRQASARRAVAHIGELLRLHGRRGFEFVTESLAPALARGLSEALIEAGLDIRWSTYLRVDRRFDLPTLQAMQRAGCRLVTLGVESTCDRALQQVQKGSDAREIEAMLDRLQAAGIPAWVNMIPDLPGTSLAEARASLHLLVTHRRALAGVSAFPLALTRSSAMGRDPAAYGLEPLAHAAASYKGLSLNDVPFRDPRGMSPAGRAEILMEYGRFAEDLRAAPRRARATALLARLATATFRFRREDVLVTPCRFVPAMGDSDAALHPSPGLLLYDVPAGTALVLPESVTPLFLFITSSKRFTLAECIEAGQDTLGYAAEPAAQAAEEFLSTAVQAGIVVEDQPTA